MPIPLIAAGVTAALFALALAFWFVGPVLLDRRTVPQGSVPAQDIIDRCTRAQETDRKHMNVWPTQWPHERPDAPFKVDEAHRVMRGIHKECRVESCERKRAAMQTLYKAGVLVPDRRIERWVIQ